MTPCVLDNSFDMAFWFLDRALNDNEYLQPQKLHRIMFLAQAYFACAHRGRVLAPATFVADKEGPLEPTIFRAFENGRPWVDTKSVAEDARLMMDSIWRRFGAHSAEHLTKMLKTHPPYVDAFRVAPRSVISLEAMLAFYGDRKGKVTSEAAQAPPPVERVLRPRVMRSHKGKPVNVHQWMPKSLKDTQGKT